MNALASTPETESAPITLDATTRAVVGLAFMSRRPVKNLQQLRVLLNDVSAAHDEVLKNGSPAQINRVAELTETGTPQFVLALQDREKLYQLTARLG